MSCVVYLFALRSVQETLDGIVFGKIVNQKQPHLEIGQGATSETRSISTEHLPTGVRLTPANEEIVTVKSLI